MKGIRVNAKLAIVFALVLLCCTIPLTVVSFANNTTLTVSANGNGTSTSEVSAANDYIEVSPYQESTPGGATTISQSSTSGPTISTNNEASLISPSADSSIETASLSSSALPDPTTTAGEDDDARGNPSNLPDTGSPFENTVLMLVTGFCLLTVGILVLSKRKKERN